MSCLLWNGFYFFIFLFYRYDQIEFGTYLEEKAVAVFISNLSDVSSSNTNTDNNNNNHNILAPVISKLDLCEGGSFSTAIFNSDIHVKIVSSCSCFISVCRFVALLKATYAENSRIVLSRQH